MIGFTTNGRSDPRFMIAGSELTGVHWLRNQPPPRQGFYHIGGSGVFLDEALLRAVGETAERYAQFVSEFTGNHEIVHATYDEMSARRKPLLDREKLCFFTVEQHATQGFPFDPFRADAPIGWVRVPSLLDDGDLFVPAQLLMVGYVPKTDRGEPWLLPAVTTGSAAHTDRTAAVANALLELVQVDSLMGHWYTRRVAPEIAFDRRTEFLQRLIDQEFRLAGVRPRFFWLANADLAGFTVACVIRGSSRIAPAIGIGLGCDMSLLPAMYKGLLEAVGVRQLAKVNLLSRGIDRIDDGSDVRLDDIFDLDSNVAYYASGHDLDFIDAKFSSTTRVAASDLPSDPSGGRRDALDVLRDSFAVSGKQLVFMDLTTIDVRALQMIAVRVWSPDTISLSFPSAPPARHQRFEAYGGFDGHGKPHPYP
jgi:thiazole/oxazole-forming peptide maturase SagD family component